MHSENILPFFSTHSFIDIGKISDRGEGTLPANLHTHVFIIQREDERGRASL